MQEIIDARANEQWVYIKLSYAVEVCW
jgi:hypothetical protein